MSETRDAIRRAVWNRPGVHFSELRRLLDVSPGQAQYHLRRLTDSGDVVGKSLYGKTHYYPPEYDDAERRVLALFRRETTRGILLVLLSDGATSPGDLADALDVAPSTLSWHLDRLADVELVERRRNGRSVTVELTEEALVARLLSDVEPSLPRRLVDRFEHLVDSLLGE